MSMKNNPVYKAINWLYYVYRRNNWMLDISRLFKDFEEINIDRPIFLLGTQGGGLTLIARILRRNQHVVSVTGNYLYWSGADEMQNVLGPILPRQLTGIKHKVPRDDNFPPPRGWLYAIDELIPKYRATRKDVTPEVQEKFKKMLRWIIARNREGRGTKRFIDKSQIYTVKVSFLNELLREHEPYFILITRNPYAVCYRSASGAAPGLYKQVEENGFEYGLKLAAQHWRNSFEVALEDGEKIDNFSTFRFEDMLQNPESQIKELCDFLDLDFNKDMLPQPEHEIPFGSRFFDRWYPLRPEVNEKYYDRMKANHVKIIRSGCGNLAKKFNYNSP